MPDEPDTFQRLTDAAQQGGLDFLLIGGHEVNAHGYERTTVDLDLLIPASGLERWKEILNQLGYSLVRQVEDFAQFKPTGDEDYRVDLMLVDDATFGKLMAGSEWVDYGRRRTRVAGVLHLIALKLHACRTPMRATDYDILQLIRLNRIDTESEEFREILKRYATPSIRERLLRDIGFNP